MRAEGRAHQSVWIMAKQQRYLITVHEHEYVLSKHEEGFSQVLVFSVDGEEVARKKTSDPRVTLESEDRPSAGRLVIKMSQLGGVRRATLHVDDIEVDLDPEPSSKAALLEAKARERPRLYAARHVVVAVGGLLLPLLGFGVLMALLLGWLKGLVPDVNVPTPDLPDIPFPDIPRPDWELPDWELPGWVGAVAGAAKFVLPVLIAIGYAVREVRRRRQQDALKESLRSAPEPSRADDEADKS